MLIVEQTGNVYVQVSGENVTKINPTQEKTFQIPRVGFLQERTCPGTLPLGENVQQDNH